MCPIVPTFTCGFVRSYFAFAIPHTLPLAVAITFTSYARLGRRGPSPATSCGSQIHVVLASDGGAPAPRRPAAHKSMSCAPQRAYLSWSPCPGLNRRPRPYQGRALPTELHGRIRETWSGKRDSNPRPPAWKAGALPLSYSRP